MERWSSACWRAAWWSRTSNRSAWTEGESFAVESKPELSDDDITDRLLRFVGEHPGVRMEEGRGRHERRAHRRSRSHRRDRPRWTEDRTAGRHVPAEAKNIMLPGPYGCATASLLWPSTRARMSGRSVMIPSTPELQQASHVCLIVDRPHVDPEPAPVGLRAPVRRVTIRIPL